MFFLSCIFVNLELSKTYLLGPPPPWLAAIWVSMTSAFTRFILSFELGTGQRKVSFLETQPCSGLCFDLKVGMYMFACNEQRIPACLF